ncbi:MAG: hypothetical protein QOH90_1079 [Actinomycetota bacterium]|nr:hypothetical protein [Actinomycetota bacterium]
MKPGAIAGEPSTSASVPARPAVPRSFGLRAVGLVLAYGYLAGLVPGSIIAVAGALFVLTAGRSLVVTSGQTWSLALSVVVLVSAIGVPAFRWGTLSLSDLRGIQSVLGSTLEVGPTQMAAGAAVAAVGALLALSTWLAAPAPTSRAGWIASSLEAGAGAVAIVTAFWGASLIDGAGVAETALALGRWIGLSVLVAGIALVAARFIGRASRVIRIVVLVVAALCTAVGFGLVAGGL